MDKLQQNIHVVSVVALIEAIFLSYMQRQIGGVQIEHDLRGCRRKTLHEQFERQLVDGVPPVVDLLVAARLALLNSSRFNLDPAVG